MYLAAPDVQIGVYADLLYKGLYRVELTAQLPYDPADVDVALQQMGFDIADADQWGRTYRHNQDRTRIAELDELEDSAEYVRLVLRQGNLDEPDVDHAKDSLDSLYSGIHQACQCDGYDDYNTAFCPCADPGVDEYGDFNDLNTERLQSTKLTYQADL